MKRDPDLPESWAQFLFASMVGLGFWVIVGFALGLIATWIAGSIIL